LISNMIIYYYTLA